MSDHPQLPAAATVIADRTSLIWVTGPDAVPFLDGLLSQNVASIAVGEGARSLLLAPNGKLRAILRVLRVDSGIGLLCDTAVVETVVGDLSRFKIRVDVEIGATAERVWEVWGPAAAAAVGYDGAGVKIRGDGIVAAYPLQRSDLPRFVASGAKPQTAETDAEAIESIRIELGEPVAGVDLDDKVIPQEVVDVSTAVDFDKGCYLGQELVARIDSRGHVNRRLAGFTFPGSIRPETGSDVVVGERVVGRLTSVGRSAEHGEGIALGMLRTDVDDGSEIVADGVPGIVRALPQRR